MVDDDVSTFPLLRLPNNVILSTLRIMNILQIFGISILSKKSKSLVESLKLTTRVFEIYMTQRFQIYSNFQSLSFGLYQNNLRTPEKIHITCENTSVTWTNLMSVKQLPDHLQFILHVSKTSLYFSSGCEKFSPDLVHRIVRNVEKLYIYSLNRENNRKVLNLFQPAEFIIWNSTLIDDCVPRHVLIQNCRNIYVLHARITLNDLLMTNSRSIRFENLEISARILNKFLKMFVKGSNPRLECMSLVFYHDAIQPGELLSGLKYEDAPSYIWRCFKTVYERKIWDVVGGWDITRFDGTKATVKLSRHNGSIRFQLFVWHDHCTIDA